MRKALILSLATGLAAIGCQGGTETEVSSSPDTPAAGGTTEATLVSLSVPNMV